MSSLLRKLSKKTSHSTQEAVIRLTNVAHTPSPASSASPPPPQLPTVQPHSSLLLVRPSTRSNTKLSDKTKTVSSIFTDCSCTSFLENKGEA